MKVCDVCGEEIYTRDGENRCRRCVETTAKLRAIARKRSKERDQIMSDLGLVKVKGALGGTYWE